jgi:NhaP-type Na+/H+ or K+/H+ antiporter
MLVGIVIDPLLGIVTPEDFGKIGSLIATIALVVILFESGTSLNITTLGESLGTTSSLDLKVRGALSSFTVI